MEIITRLEVVGRTVNDAVQRAGQEVYHRHNEHPRSETLESEISPLVKASADLPAGPKSDGQGLSRDRTALLTAIMLTAGVVTGLVLSQLPPTPSVDMFADGLMGHISADLAQLDERWQGARKANAGDRDVTPGAVQFADDDRCQWRSREIANRIQPSQRAVGQCLQVRIDR